MAEPWEDWAPPLNPPTEGGLNRETAQRYADLWWDDDPHYCAGLQWDAYAMMLTPEPAVTSVSTGAQSVTYSEAVPAGEYGRAYAKAKAHFDRSLNGAGGLVSLPLSRRFAVVDPTLIFETDEPVPGA